DSTLAEAYIGMGLVHTRRYFRGWFSGGEGALETARQEFRRAIALDPRSGEARGGLVRTLWEKGRSVECLQLLKEIPAENAENFTDLMVRGEGYVLSGLSERAIPYLEHTTEVDHDSDWAAWMLTLAYAFSERYRDATVAGKRFLARFGDDREILHWLSLSQFALGEVWEAEASCRQEIEAGPSSIGDNDGRYNLFAGCLLDKLGKQEEAKKAWAEGLQTVDERLIAQSDNLRMHALRAAFCVLLGKEQQLASEQRLLFQDLGRSGYGENMMFFALALAKRGKSDEAARILRGAAAARVVSPYTFLFRHPAFKADVESGDHSGQVRAALAELESVTKSVNSAF
ncbi:MAG TPA: tetratricopeptide repeat protein, partial [Candidatus Eisenbacteria bacterium]|nr:tetratricopeptide repeat protein [Candidatus Eisenbacteria bacterium]